jgi:hypothetical protein
MYTGLLLEGTNRQEKEVIVTLPTVEILQTDGKWLTAQHTYFGVRHGICPLPPLAWCLPRRRGRLLIC